MRITAIMAVKTILRDDGLDRGFIIFLIRAAFYPAHDRGGFTPQAALMTWALAARLPALCPRMSHCKR